MNSCAILVRLPLDEDLGERACYCYKNVASICILLLLHDYRMYWLYNYTDDGTVNVIFIIALCSLFCFAVSSTEFRVEGSLVRTIS